MIYVSGVTFTGVFWMLFSKHFHGVVILKGVETDGNVVVTIILTLPGWNRTISPNSVSWFSQIITEVNCFPIKQMCHWSNSSQMLLKSQLNGDKWSFLFSISIQHKVEYLEKVLQSNCFFSILNQRPSVGARSGEMIISKKKLCT